ncbi:MAG TPA: hypothetical protein VJR89_28045, partial [Polyangiales bacterium]|nr:hypothetical protein [Polyangiales bacterium]
SGAAGAAGGLGAMNAAGSPPPPNTAGRPAVDAGMPAPPAPKGGKAILERLKALYEPDAKAQNRSLEINILDEDRLPIARSHGGADAWGITVSQAFLEGQMLSDDVMATVFCQEIGWLFGGFPFLGGTQAAEGQAAYYASKECLRRLWVSDVSLNAAAGNGLDASLRKQCDDALPSAADRGLCYRTVRAAQDSTRWFERATTYPPAKLTTPDPTVVDRTNVEYITPQCRIDTLLHGALCDKRFAANVIPGLAQSNTGINTPEAERAAAEYSCTSGAGARPACWFKPDTKPVDCSAIPANGACTTENDERGTLYCDPNHGPQFSPCFPNEVCEVTDLARCTSPGGSSNDNGGPTIGGVTRKVIR